MKKASTNLLELRKVWILSPGIQIFLIAFLFTVTTLWGYFDYQRTGLLFGYPLAISVLFAPIYEEIIFRGILLSFFLKLYQTRNAIILTSLLFGLWHLKNIFYFETDELAYQIFYTACIFSPIMCAITLKTKTIWIEVILHYLNNLWAPISWILLEKII